MKTLLIILCLVLLSTEGQAARYTQEEYTCVGTYKFIDKTIQDDLVEVYIERWNDGRKWARFDIYSAFNDEDGQSYQESSGKLVLKNERIHGANFLGIFDKEKKTLMFVADFGAGDSNKFTGDCY